MAHYDWTLAVDPATGNPAPGSSFDFYDSPGGSVQSVTDFNGTPQAHLVASADGIIPQFIATLTRGYLWNGSFYLPILSIEAQDGAAAVGSAQSARDSASTAASSASESASNAQAAANSAAASAVIAQAQPGLVTVVQNVDNTWPDRRTVTTARSKIVGYLYRNADSSTWPATAAIDATLEADLAKPTPADLFAAYNA